MRAISIPAFVILLAIGQPSPAAAQAVMSGKKGPLKGKGPLANRPALERFSRMSPEERQRALERLPPERRRKIEEQLREFNSLTPAERRRLEEFRQLPPERQEVIRRMFRRMNNMPDDRRALLRQELRRLHEMPEAERESRMNSEEFRSQYTPVERRVIGELSTALPPS